MNTQKNFDKVSGLYEIENDRPHLEEPSVTSNPKLGQGWVIHALKMDCILKRRMTNA